MNARVGQVNIFPGISTIIQGYNGAFPGPIIEARSGQPIALLLTNSLAHPIVHHLHGGRVPPTSDGFPMDFIVPLPSRSSLPSLADVKPGTAGQGWQSFDYPNQQRGATLWYHDHRMDYTGQQVWKGLFGTYLLRDDEELSLGLPRDDRELVLTLADRSFDAAGQLNYPVSGLDQGLDEHFMGGLLGDVLLVNGDPWPTHSVATGLYRLRILNCSNSRDYNLELDRTMPAGYQFMQIGSDGGLLHKPAQRRQICLAPAERVDLLVDFSGCEIGRPIHLLNVGERGLMANVMQFIPRQSVHERAHIPEVLSSLPLPRPSPGMVERTFEFKYSRPKRSWTVNGLTFDPNRIDARPRLGSTEIWHLRSDFTHPLHLHLVHFAVIQHAGSPTVEDQGWKDTINMVAGETATIVVPFDGYAGKYVFHCHNLEHEDMRMMANFEVIA